jgi:phage gp16-like protein
VKPKLKSVVAKKNRMLFKQTVKAGPAKATVYKNLKLIKRR